MVRRRDNEEGEKKKEIISKGDLIDLVMNV